MKFIHREGRKLIIAFLVFLVLLNICVRIFFPEKDLLNAIVLVVSLVSIIFTMMFFRNPKRKIFLEEGAIIAPADGKVVVIEETYEGEYFHDKRVRISIFMSVKNVHVNRTPISGQVKYFKYHPGKYLVAWHPKSSTENERTTVVAKMKNGTEILFRQIAGALARRIKWYVKEGQPLEQGEEFGFIKFGSRVDIFLPLNAKINVSIGEVTKGGRTVIAELA